MEIFCSMLFRLKGKLEIETKKKIVYWLRKVFIVVSDKYELRKFKVGPKKLKQNKYIRNKPS